MAKIKAELDAKDYEEFINAVKRLGTIPKSALRAATRKQAVKIMAAIKSNPLTPRGKEAARKSDISDQMVPASTKLEKGLKIAYEKRSKSGKAVQQIRFAEEKNYIFVRLYAKKTKRAYYPSSMEFGFKRDGKQVFQGTHFMKRIAGSLSAETKREFLNDAGKRIEKMWVKKTAKFK